MPLVIVGTPSGLDEAAARPPRRRRPRRRCRGSAPAGSAPAEQRRRSRSTASGSGSAAAARPAAGRRAGGGVEELVHRHVDEDRAAVRASRRRVNASSHAVERRRRRSGWCAASLETGAKIGGWSSSWRLPLPQRFCGARPPTTTIGEPANCAWAIALTPLVTPGPGGEHGEPGDPGQLAGRLGGERRGLLVAYVEEPHRRVGLDRAVVHREDVRAGEREHRLDAVRPRDGDGELAGVALDRAGRCVVGCRARSCTGHDGRSRGSWRPGGTPGWWRAARRRATSSRSERTCGRLGRRARAGGRARAGTPRRCRRRGSGSRSSYDARAPAVAASRAIHGSSTRSGTRLRRRTAIVARGQPVGLAVAEQPVDRQQQPVGDHVEEHGQLVAARCGDRARVAERVGAVGDGVRPALAGHEAAQVAARAAARSRAGRPTRGPCRRAAAAGALSRAMHSPRTSAEKLRRKTESVSALAEPDAEPGGHPVAEAGEQVVVDARGRPRWPASGRRCRRASPGR